MWKDLTVKWIKIVIILNHEAILRLLSCDNVARNALYYHDNVIALSDVSTVSSPSSNLIKVGVCAIQNSNR